MHRLSFLYAPAHSFCLNNVSVGEINNSTKSLEISIVVREPGDAVYA